MNKKIEEENEMQREELEALIKIIAIIKSGKMSEIINTIIKEEMKKEGLI